MMCCVTFGVTGCHRKGCTDAKANNYDSRSKKDDKSCTYDYTKFIGSYQMEENCSGQWNYQLVINKNEDLSFVTLNNLGGWANEVVVKAAVLGSDLSFDEIANDFRFVGTGRLSEADTLFLNYKTFDLNGEEQSSCTSSGKKQ